MDQEDSKPLLLELINSTIQVDLLDEMFWFVGGKKMYKLPVFTALKLCNTEQSPSNKMGKIYILDILAIMNDGTVVNVELQNRMNDYTFSRFARYAHRLSSEQLGVGENYDKAQSVISIILSNGTPLEPENTNYVSMYATMKVDNQRMRTDDIIYYEVEMQKFKASDYRQLRKLDALMMYFTSGKLSPKDWMDLIRILPELEIAKAKEELFVRDDKLYTDYILEKDAEMVYNTGIYRAEERGREEGRVQATYSLVKSFLTQGFPVEAISEASGLSIDEIESIKASL